MIEAVLGKKTSSEEDKLTSTIIGLLKYLPGEMFWYIMRRSCADSSNLSKENATLTESQFWPHLNSRDTKNSKFVEPDVLLRFEKFDLIIEAKLFEDGGQTRQQWENQIIAYLNENYDESKDINLNYIALGGNQSKKNEQIVIRYNEKLFNITINKCNWLGILFAVSDVLEELKSRETPFPSKGSIIILLEDVIRGFNHFGYYQIDWFHGMQQYEISENKTNLNFI